MTAAAAATAAATTRGSHGEGPEQDGLESILLRSNASEEPEQDGLESILLRSKASEEPEQDGLESILLRSIASEELDRKPAKNLSKMDSSPSCFERNQYSTCANTIRLWNRPKTNSEVEVCFGTKIIRARNLGFEPKTFRVQNLRFAPKTFRGRNLVFEPKTFCLCAQTTLVSNICS